jgi:hypothetical protein
LMVVGLMIMMGMVKEELFLHPFLVGIERIICMVLILLIMLREKEMEMT